MRRIVIISIITSTMLFSNTVDNMIIESTNAINNGTTIKDYSDVQQGTVDIQNSTVKNLKLNSLNDLKDVEVYGAQIEQATLKINDSNASDSDANNIDINAKNTISGGLVDVESGVYQSETQFSSSTVDGLNLDQTDTLKNTNIEESELSQSQTITDNSKLSNMSQKVNNNVSDSEIVGLSLVEQATTSIDSSTVNNLTTKEDNEVDTATVDEAELRQGQTIIKG